jgi:glycosyltransferase involved in cell wall biosynthesis
MGNPLVTVYITNHNYGRFIKQSIESVLRQSHQNFELIIIDDGSIDNSREIIDQYESSPKINVVYQERRGLTISNNIALNLARGKYIIRLDADDYLDKNALKVMIGEFDDVKVGMVFGDWYIVDSNNEVIGVERRHNFKNDVSMYDQPANGACTMFRTKCLRMLGGYNEDIHMQDGYELWLRFIEHYELRNLNIPVFYYRKHSNNLTNNESLLLNTRAKILKDHAGKRNIKRPKVVAIVPVRGGSLDFMSRPFVKLRNKYLIDWTLSVFARSESIDKVVVTSPSEEILEYTLKNYDSKKFDVMKRSVELARLNSNIDGTINYVFNNIDIKSYDYFLIYTIEAPFLREEFIISAISTMQIFGTDTVIPVRTVGRYFYKHSGNGMEPLNYSKGFIRLEKDQWYAGVTNFLLRDVDDYINTNSYFGKKIGHIVFDKKAAFELEDDLDIKMAELILDEFSDN